MKTCPYCGNQLADDMQFCNNCGANQYAAPASAAAAQAPQYTQAPQYAQPQYAQPPVGSVMGSDWDGGVLDTVVNSIVASLIITFTCGIATPWAICYMMKFVISHAIVDGRRLSFTGTGGSLFGNWIKWMLLTVITCGIYSFWVIPRMYKWVVSHIHYE